MPNPKTNLNSIEELRKYVSQLQAEKDKLEKELKIVLDEYADECQRTNHLEAEKESLEKRNKNLMEARECMMKAIAERNNKIDDLETEKDKLNFKTH